MTAPGGYSAGTIFLQVVPSFRDFHQALRREAKVANKAWADAQDRARREQADKDKAAAEKRGRDSGGAYSKALNDAISKAAKALPEVKVQADTSEVDQAIARLKGELDRLDKKDIKLGADSREAVREIQTINRLLQRLALESANPEIVVDTAAAQAELTAFLKRFSSVERARAEVEIDVDWERADRGIRRVLQGLNDLDRNGNALRAFSGRALGAAIALPLLAPAAVAAAGAIAAIAPAAVAGATGLGILIAGFTGLGDAVTALGDVQKNAAKDAETAGRQQRAAAKTLRDAQQAVARARQDAADGAEDAARRVSDAQARQGDVEQSNARRMQDALARQQRAERDLIDAQRDARRAQDDLTRARQEAQDQLEDLALRAKGGALAERAAVVDLFEAQVAYNAARADGAATNLDREQAAIALEQARLRLEQQRLDNGRLAEEQAAAASRGVDGTDRVQQAQERAADAQQRQVDAQREVREAGQDTARVQQENARATAEAAEDVQDALQAQSRAARDSAVAIRDAQESLADAQVNYADSLDRTSASQDKLNEAMSKLGPEGQAFARFLYGEILPGLREMRESIQAGLLPGVTDALRLLTGTYGPQLTAFLGVMGEVLGDVFRDLSVLFTTPVFVEFFDMMGEYLPIFTEQWGTLGGVLLTLFAQLLTAFAPLGRDFMQFLIDAGTRLSEFLASAEGQQALQNFMETVRETGPQVADFLGALVRAIVNLGKALAPYAAVMLTFLTGFLDFVAGMDPILLGVIAIGIVGITLAAQGLLGIASLLSVLATALTVASASVIGIVAAVALGVVALAVAFIYAYRKSETFRDIVNGAVSAVGAVLSFVWKNIIQPTLNFVWEAFKFAGDVIVGVLDLIGTFFIKTFEGIADWWEEWTSSGFGKSFRDFWGDIVGFFVSVWAQAWEDVKMIFSKGVYFVIETVINDGLVDGFNAIADKVRSKTIPRIDLPASFGKQDGDKEQPRRRAGFATGGMVPGFSPTPTADNIPAWLTAGEFVLPVNAVKSLRSAYGDDFLEALRRGMPGYAKGGVVGFGRELQKRGFRVSEHPAFGGVSPVHKGRGHYEGRAVDVNYGPGGTSAVEQQAIDAIIGLAKTYGLGSIWRTKGHYDHAHFEQGGVSILGRIGDLADNAIDAVLGQPAQWLLDKVTGQLDRLPDNILSDLLRSGVKTVASMLANPLRDDVTQVGDVAATGYAEGGYVGGAPVLYDTGGWLQPGLTTVLNATGKPEPVFTSEQWDTMRRGGGGGGTTIEVHAQTVSTANDIANEVLFASRQISRGGVHATRKAT